MMARWTWLALAAACSLALDAQAETLRVGLSQPTFSFVPLDIAISQDLCKPHGVEIEKIVFHGGSELHQAITAGSVDVGLGAGPEFGFLVKGAPEKAIAAMSDRPADLALVVLKDGPIHSIADLKGKKVSMSTRGSLTEWAARELSQREGWSRSGMTLVPLGSFGAQTAALKTHQIDGMSVEATTAGRLEEEGTGRTLVSYGDIVPDFHIHVIFAADAAIKAHPDVLTRFMACWLDTVAYTKTHKPEAVKAGSEALDISVALSGKLYEAIVPTYNITGRFDPKALSVIAQALVDMGTFLTKPDLSKYLTEQFLPPAP